MNKLLQVRREYGEPFVDVVKGFAELGYSRTATAKVLGFNLSYFRQLIKRFNLDDFFKPQREMRQCCKGGQYQGGRWPKGQGRLNIRKPIIHNEITYVPGEPTHHYLFEKGVR